MIENKKSYDPQMHSAEHILNQTMIRLFGCDRSFNNHIEKKKSKCDYRFTRNLEENEIANLENNVNSIIMQDLNVTEEFFSKADALTKFKLNKLPEDSGEIARVIKIGDYDECLCSGPHVKSTLEIGKFKIISTSYEDGVLRLRFKLDRS